MGINKMVRGFALLLMIIFVFAACAKQGHWGQKFDMNGKWWEKEGQSWDRRNNIFMTIGYSNPDWTDPFDLRRSSDTDARAQVAAFMQTLMDNYMEEVRMRDFAVSKSTVKASAKETILGSVIVSRHHDKKNKKYYSLIKVDLNYFFNDIYDEYKHDTAKKIRSSSKGMSKEELDQKIKEGTEKALKDLRAIEEPVIKESLKESKGL